MGNEQSGSPDGTADPASTDGGPSAPSTPRPILRNAAGGGGHLSDEKNRRNVVFRDQTEDALRFNHSILRSSAGGSETHSQSAATGGGLTRLSQQVNNLNGGLQRQAVAESLQANGQARRPARTQKPPAPAPPSVVDGGLNSEKDAAAEPMEDSRVSRMREYVFALAEKKEKNRVVDVDPNEGRLYDPSKQELPTVTEELEERDDTLRRGLSKADSTETLKEEIKQEILRDLLSHSSSPSQQQQAIASAEGAVYGAKIGDAEKKKLIAEIRQQLLGQHPLQAPTDFTEGSLLEPDYSEDESATPAAEQPPRQLTRFSSELEMSSVGVGNGHYRSPLQPRRFKGPAPAPPNARYRRSGGPPVVREPYQEQWEEPIFAYDRPQTEEQLQEQMEKAYDDRYRQKSRSKRFGDSWKRMTASLSKAFGFNNNSGDSGGTRKSGIVRRSSVQDSTFDRPGESRNHQQQQQQQGFRGNRTGSVYSLASAETPPMEQQQQQQQQQQQRLAQQLMQHHHQRAPLPTDIWRDVAQASHDQMLHTRNPVFSYQSASANVGSEPSRAPQFAAGSQSESAAWQSRSPIARVTVPPLNANKVNANGENTYL
ncbi:hypothetical protein BOX15_Mlig023765g3 [Macrostomum lignano]|uniref:Uncharacterized protein n=1 Tax=Macrostomum lignano TaxID=282301 RepID=A0A267H135_9PLAT|nr:hypothetical protein BOX15_Mlig023765g3 [Macrostomum lignano]